MQLIINKPIIKENRLISTIEYGNNKYNLFFEVDNQYKEYLCDSNANAFLISLLPFIVKHNYDVIVKSKISSKLYYQLTTYLLPLLCQNFKKKKVNIKCELTNKIYNGSAVGASISCGVDSFYTLLKHKKQLDCNYNITHLCFFNAGSNGEYGGISADSLYKERVNHVINFCNLYNYKFVCINSNMNELIMMSHEKRHTFTTLACVYVLEKLFGKYYFASGFGFNGSHIDENDTSFYDILNVQCLSNENITFYCSGLETNRLDKIRYISNFSETYKWLNVCVGKEWKNCCKCTKCIRTMTELESICALEKYKQVFDIDYYYKNRTKILTKVLIDNKDKIQHQFYDDVIKNYKKNNIKIPIKAYIMSYMPYKKNIKRILIKLLPDKIINYILLRKKSKKINDGWLD